MSGQLGLFDPPPTERPPDRWVTGQVPDLTGGQQYVAMIRDPDDPKRSRRRSRNEHRDRAPHLTLKKTRPEDWHDAVAGLLKAEGPMTMNALGVLLIDKTADIVVGTPFEAGIWQLVAAGRVEFTMDAPVLFRRV